MKRKPKKSHNKRDVRKRHPRIAKYADMMGRHMTAAERSFYYAAKPSIRRLKKQCIIECHGKTYIADFYLGCAQIVIEIDGDDHARKKGYDDERTSNMNKKGIVVIRFSNERALKDPDYCVSVLSQWMYHRMSGNQLTQEAASHEHKVTP